MENINTLNIIKGDAQPYYKIQVLDLINATPTIPLSGADVTFSMRNLDTGVISISGNSSNVYITDYNKWIMEYRWGGGDTDIIGNYQIEFKIIPQAGGQFTIPNPEQGRALVRIEERMDFGLT